MMQMSSFAHMPTTAEVTNLSDDSATLSFSDGEGTYPRVDIVLPPAKAKAMAAAFNGHDAVDLTDATALRAFIQHYAPFVGLRAYPVEDGQ